MIEKNEEIFEVSSYEDCFILYPDTHVLAYKYYGKHSGTAIFKIEHKGEISYIELSYGSCSGCDEFEHQSMLGRLETLEEIISFSEPFINSSMTKEALIQYLKNNCYYGSEAENILYDLENGWYENHENT